MYILMGNMSFDIEKIDINNTHTHVYMRVWLSAEGAKNVSWPWLSLLRGWGSLAMTFTGKFV